MSKQSKEQLNLHDIYGDKDSESDNATNQKQENEEVSFEDVLEEVERELNPQDQNEIYQVYILSRVVNETIRMCKEEAPNEAIGILLGYKMQYKGKKYVKVVDWVTGKSNRSNISAKFTPEGVRQYTSYIDEKYQDAEFRPKIVGIIHSHPFGHNPHFSGTDYNTFLNFPYDAVHNVFVLVDPLASYYKAYVVVKDEKGRKDLAEVDWVEYYPQ